MKKIATAYKVVATVAFSAACALPVMAQNTTPTDSTPTSATTMPTTMERGDDNERDYGWIGLLGLAGLLGLRKKHEEHRPNNLSQQR